MYEEALVDRKVPGRRKLKYRRARFGGDGHACMNIWRGVGKGRKGASVRRRISGITLRRGGEERVTRKSRKEGKVGERLGGRLAGKLLARRMLAIPSKG